MNETRTGYYFEDLEIGMEASYSRTVSEMDIATFAALSGDDNPLHLDEYYAAQTMFKSRIAHGILTAGYISTVLGTKLPGLGAIYVSQSLKFLAPVRIGDTVVASARVVDLIAEKKRAVLACQCTVNDKPVITGEAVLMVPSRG